MGGTEMNRRLAIPVAAVLAALAVTAVALAAGGSLN